MLTKDLLDILNKISPFELQEKWDNCGLNIGDKNRQINSIYTSIDIDLDLISKVSHGDCIITHHPLIFAPLRVLDFSTYPSNLIKKIMDKDLSIISLHTNFDKTHLNSFVAKSILEWENTINEDFIISTKKEILFDDLIIDLKSRLDLKNVTYIKCKEKIDSISLTTGSGISFLDNCNSDCFLTGDIKYHDAMRAKSIGISLIDISHYHSEKFFAQILANELKTYGVVATISNSKDPFTSS